MYEYISIFLEIIFVKRKTLIVLGKSVLNFTFYIEILELIAGSFCK